MSGQEKLTEHAPARKGVLCAKCEHLNERGRNICEFCGAHLHVVCHDCGTHNERVRTRCIECGHRLHRSFLSRTSSALFGKNRKLGMIQIVLLILGILIGIAAVVYFSSVLSSLGGKPPLK